MTPATAVHLTITETARLLQAGTLSPVALTEAYLDRIEALNPLLNAFITVHRETALAQSRIAEREMASGHYRGPLHGIPVAIGDLFATAGELRDERVRAARRATCHELRCHPSSRGSRKRVAFFSARSLMMEFANGDDVNPLTGQHPTRNPWNLDRSVSGSSSGSAAAVCASLCAGALGSDSGGSIRLPASFCGIVGMKPTYGRVSRHGATPLSWSLDHVGPMTRSVADCALMLEAIAGADASDRTCSRRPVPDYCAGLDGGVKGLRIGLPTNHFSGLLHP